VREPEKAVAREGGKPAGRSIGAFLGELQRRKVVQNTTVYLVAAWGLSAGAADIFGALELPEWAARYVVIGVFAMTPLVVVISWLYEVNNRGIRRDYGPPDEQVSVDTMIVRRDQRPPLTLSYAGRSETFYRDVIVGRDDSCGFQIIEPLISRRHVKFEYVDGRWRVRDLGSANGTRLDGREVDTAWLESDATIVLYPDADPLRVSLPKSASSDPTIIRPSTP
jgi:hypothetical protein